MIELEETGFWTVEYIRNLAHKEKLAINEVCRSHWFRIFYNREQVGFAGFAKARAAFWKIKAIYIFPQYRSKGFGTATLNHFIEFARKEKVRVLEATVYSPKWLKKRGWCGHKNKSGRWKMNLKL